MAVNEYQSWAPAVATLPFTGVPVAVSACAVVAEDCSRRVSGSGAGAAAEALCCCALHLGSCHACSQLLSFRELKLRSKLRHLVDRIVLLGAGQVTDAGSAFKVFRHFGGRFVEILQHEVALGHEVLPQTTRNQKLFCKVLSSVQCPR